MTRIPLVLVCVAACGCARPSLASFVPELTVGVRVVRARAGLTPELARGAPELGTHAFVTLTFRAHDEASALPSRVDTSGLALAVPCDDDDAACFEELADAERELAPLGQEDVP